jgi:hypothetical protein
MILTWHNDQHWNAARKTGLQDVFDQEALSLRSQDFVQVPENKRDAIPFRDGIDELAVIVKAIADRKRPHSLDSKPSQQKRIYTLKITYRCHTIHSSHHHTHLPDYTTLPAIRQKKCLSDGHKCDINTIE